MHKQEYQWGNAYGLLTIRLMFAGKQEEISIDVYESEWILWEFKDEN